jgi:hypothetical protein
MTLDLTPAELSVLHGVLEGHAEVLGDDGNHVEEDRLLAMVNDHPIISKEDAEWLVEVLQNQDDDMDAMSLRNKLATLLR